MERCFTVTLGLQALGHLRRVDAEFSLHVKKLDATLQESIAAHADAIRRLSQSLTSQTSKGDVFTQAQQGSQSSLGASGSLQPRLSLSASHSNAASRSVKRQSSAGVVTSGSNVLRSSIDADLDTYSDSESSRDDGGYPVPPPSSPTQFPHPISTELSSPPVQYPRLLSYLLLPPV